MLLSLDHIELFVPDREAAAKWYGEVLGFSIVKELAHHAKDPQGPLMISGDGGSTKIALFEGEPQGKNDFVGPYLIAFRASAEQFIAFLQKIDTLSLYNHNGNLVRSSMVRDHKDCWSIYFNDPWGTRLEVTTYDYDTVKSKLNIP